MVLHTTFPHPWMENPNACMPVRNSPQIGKTPNVRPKAADIANCFGSVPLQFPSNTEMSVDLSLSPSSWSSVSTRHYCKFLQVVTRCHQGQHEPSSHSPVVQSHKTTRVLVDNKKHQSQLSLDSSDAHADSDASRVYQDPCSLMTSKEFKSLEKDQIKS
jgi:hypothetical protein